MSKKDDTLFEELSVLYHRAKRAKTNLTKKQKQLTELNNAVAAGQQEIDRLEALLAQKKTELKNEL